VDVEYFRGFLFGRHKDNNIFLIELGIFNQFLIQSIPIFFLSSPKLFLPATTTLSMLSLFFTVNFRHTLVLIVEHLINLEQKFVAFNLSLLILIKLNGR